MFTLDCPQQLSIALGIGGIQGQWRMLGCRSNDPSFTNFSPDHCFVLLLAVIPTVTESIIGRRRPWNASKSKRLFDPRNNRKVAGYTRMGRRV